MRLPYMAVSTRQPVPSLGGLKVRHRPVVAVLLSGSATPQLRDGLLDTGADDTVFSDAVASALGIDLSHAEQRAIALAGRPQPLICRYSQVQIRISDRPGRFAGSHGIKHESRGESRCRNRDVRPCP